MRSFIRQTLGVATVLAGLSCGTTSLLAQKVPGGCGTPAHTHNLLINNPQAQAHHLTVKDQMAALEAQLQVQLAAGGYKTGQVLTVPVVFHVLYNNSAENIPDASLLTQIDVLNEDFRRQNADASNTKSMWRNLATDIEIEFCLAKVDPNGDATDGITRTETSIRSFNISSTEIYSTADGGHDAWDTDSYLNIWVCDLGSSLYGFATPPGTASADEDGVVLNYTNVGRGGVAVAPANKGRTGTHEVGHYFNLEHIWGDAAGCSTDDGVADTPVQDEEHYGCPTDDPSSCGNSGDMYQNYMDYVDDDCMNLFTQGQKTRMLAALTGPRSGLISNAQNVCDLPSGLNPSTLPLQFSLGPNPTSGTTTLRLNFAPLQEINLLAYNALGQVIWQQTLPAAASHEVLVPAGNWPAGVYLLTLSSNGQPLASRQLVVSQ